LNVSWAEPQTDKNFLFNNEDNPRARTLLVNNLSINVQEDDLRSLFGTYGIITKCIIVKDQNTGEPKGFAYVEFKDKESCIPALTALNNYDLLGQNLSISFSNQNNRNKQKLKNWNKNGPNQFDDNRFNNRFNNRKGGVQRNNFNNNMRGKKGKFNDNNKGFRKNFNNNNPQNRGQKNFNRGYQNQNTNTPVMSSQMYNQPVPNTPGVMPQGFMNPLMGNDWRNVYMQGMNQSTFQYNNNNNTNRNNTQQDKTTTGNAYPYMNYQQPNYQYMYPSFTDQNYYAYYNNYSQQYNNPTNYNNNPPTYNTNNNN